MPDPQRSPQTLFGEDFVKRWFELQSQELVNQRHRVDRMKAWDHGMPRPKLTRWQRLTRWAGYQIRRARVALARWIAGDEWPEED